MVAIFRSCSYYLFIHMEVQIVTSVHRYVVNLSLVNTKTKPGGSRVPLNDRGRHLARAPTQTRQWVWDLLRSPCETGDHRWWKMAFPHIAGPSYFSPRIGYAIPKYEPLNWPVYRPFFLFLFYMI